MERYEKLLKLKLYKSKNPFSQTHLDPQISCHVCSSREPLTVPYRIIDAPDLPIGQCVNRPIAQSEHLNHTGQDFTRRQCMPVHGQPR